MDVYETIRRDHDRIHELFRRLRAPATGDTDDCQSIFNELDSVLSNHMEAEEQTLYATMLDMGQASELVILAKEDHYVMKSLLADLELVQLDDAQWRAKLDALFDRFEAHVRLEEGRLFAKARQAVGDAEAHAFAKEFQDESASLDSSVA